MKAREIVNERLKTMRNTSALELIVRIRLNELIVQKRLREIKEKS